MRTFAKRADARQGGGQILLRAGLIQLFERAMIVGCEVCTEDAEIPFDNVLDRVTVPIVTLAVTPNDFQPEELSVSLSSPEVIRTPDLRFRKP